MAGSPSSTIGRASKDRRGGFRHRRRRTGDAGQAIIVNVISGAALAAIVFTIDRWVSAYYESAGLTPGDAGVGIAIPVATVITTLVVMLLAAVVVALELVGLGLLLRADPIRLVLTFVGAPVLAGVAIGTLGTPAFAIVTAAVIGGLVYCLIVTVRIIRSHRVAAWIASSVVGALISIILYQSITLTPSSYRDEYDELRSASFDDILRIGFPLPGGFAIASDAGREWPVVILERDVWLTTIDPCGQLRYHKVLVRFDEVRLEEATFERAMALCPD